MEKIFSHSLRSMVKVKKKVKKQTNRNHGSVRDGATLVSICT